MSKILHYCRYNKKSVTKHLRAESVLRSQFSDHKSCQIITCLTLVSQTNVHADFRVYGWEPQSGPCLVWCPWIISKWRYNVINFSLDLTRPPYWGFIRINEWKLLAVCHHPDKFGDHRYFDNGDIMFMICHWTSRDQIFKGLCEFMGRSPLR